MSFSLTHFLDFNILILSMFPWIKGFLVEKKISKAAFSTAFISTSIFLFIYMYFTKANFIKNIFFSLSVREILISIMISLLCIGIEIVIFLLKYKKITFLKIEKDCFTVFLILTLIIPAIEEFIFRGCIYCICEEYFNTKIPFIFISSVCFGLNHIIYPKINIFTKFIWGILLSLEFIFFNNLFCTIITHILCNLFIYFMGKKQK